MVQGRPGDERGRGVGSGAPSGAGQRLFVAVPLPAETLGFVIAAQRLLPSVPGLRLMHADQLHVTLAFIGEVGDDKAHAARQVVESVPVEMGGDAVIERLLLLPSPGRARVVALELRDGDRVFARLFEEVMGGLERAGVMQREKRPFRPHLTIARLRDAGAVQPRLECGEARYAVESVCLYESVLKREGALYTVRARTALACKKA
jgi:RNA 2',3'-cyclic 3'-phosphodiesterase